MEVRLLSVGTRGFFLVASRLAIAAQFCRPQREKNLWHQGTRQPNDVSFPLVQRLFCKNSFAFRAEFFCNNVSS